MTTQNQPVVTSSDRFSFMLIIALAVHVLLIFGISFSALPTAYEDQKAKEVIEVKLQAEISDEESDFLADSNQQGSGESDESHILSTTEQADFNDTQINQTNQSAPIFQYFYQPESENQIITTEKESSIQVEQQNKTEEEKKITEPSPIEQVNLDSISQKIESLNLKLARIEEIQAKRPKQVWNTAMSAKEDVEAAYVYRLINKIESIGNTNYPQAAIDQNLSGTIRVVFVLDRQGELISFEIAKSSGHQVLDSAVQHIISQASPFEHFTPSLIKADIQEVHIIRTWIFDSNQNFKLETL